MIERYRTHPVMAENECHRLQGKSILDGDGCRCFLDNDGGFLQCPEKARGVIIEVLPAPKPAPKLTGDFCDTCGGSRMVRTGVCLTCQDCGSSSGGCS